MSSSYAIRDSKKIKKKSTLKPAGSLVKDSRQTKKLNNSKVKLPKKSLTSESDSRHIESDSRHIESVTSAGIKWNQEKPRDWDPYENGNYSEMPYEAPNAINFIGGIGANIGHRRSKKFINRRTVVEEIYNMRTNNKPLFSFFEDPRSANNLPLRIRPLDHDEIFLQDTVHRIGGIKHEQCLETIEECDSTTSSKDPNVKQPDTSDHSNITNIETNKERNYELRKQFLSQRRALKKAHINSQLPVDLGFEYRKEKFKLSEYYDLSEKIPEDNSIESIREVAVDWTEMYRVSNHECDLRFDRPMPKAIPLTFEKEKLSFLTRTLDKPENIEILNRELLEFSKPIELTAKEDIKSRDTQRQLEKILNKQNLQQLPNHVAMKDFDDFLKSTNVFNIPKGEKKFDDKKGTLWDHSLKDDITVAMKDFENKINQGLSVLDDDTASFVNLPQSSIESETFITKTQSKKHSVNDTNKMPVDFTYAFDTSLNNKLKKYIRAEHKLLSNEEINEDPIDAATNQSEINIHSNEAFKEACDGPHPLIDEKRKSKTELNKLNKSKTSSSQIKIERNNSNFTNDSGSFIVAQGKKIHFDKLKISKKSSQSKAEKSTNDFDQYLRPYTVLPLIEAKKIDKKDKNLVPQCDMKERLKVDIPQYESELIGTEGNKHLSHLATEWDEYYQKELINRPRIRRFKPRTMIKQIVDSLRLKYESIYKHQYLTEKAIIIEQEKLFIKRAEEFRDVCVAFFSNLRTTRYRQSMAVIQDLRPMYELNDRLTFEVTTVNNKLIQLKTAIIHAEGKVREATILQNVSYLIMEPNWREKHDWIHKRRDGTFETIKESIENRMTTNLRKKDNDNVWSIKEFFERNIFRNRRPALVAFSSPEAIKTKMASFQIHLYLSLLKLDLLTWTLMNLKYEYNKYIEWSIEFIDRRKKYVEACCARKYFQEHCAASLKTNAFEIIDGKLVETITEKTLRTLVPLCDLTFKRVIPENVQEQLKDDNVLEKFRLIINQAMSLLEQLDAIPSTIRKEIEKKIRRDKSYQERLTKRAIDLETYISNAKKIMMKHSSPIYKRPPRTGKLPRSHLLKPTPTSKTVKPETEGIELVPLSIKTEDFQSFVDGTTTPQEFYLDSTFFGGNIEIPNFDFLPEMKSNINEFIVDVKNVMKKWDKNKQEEHLANAHLAWTADFRKN